MPGTRGRLDALAVGTDCRRRPCRPRGVLLADTPSDHRRVACRRGTRPRADRSGYTSSRFGRTDVPLRATFGCRRPEFTARDRSRPRLTDVAVRARAPADACSGADCSDCSICAVSRARRSGTHARVRRRDDGRGGGCDTRLRRQGRKRTRVSQTGIGGGDLVSALNRPKFTFATASAEVPAEMADFLKRAADEMKRLPPGHVLEIAGYTDSSGNPARNVTLSQKRAAAVRQALIEAGVNAGTLVAKGYGSADPIGSNDTPEGRLRDRRIEFHVVKTP